jgi:hypothetical protein
VKAARVTSQACERARTWASLGLDGELSELERSLLRAHLDRCASCSAFAREVGAVTEALRAAPLEALERPIALPQRRRFAFRPVEAAAAAAIAVVGMAGILGAAQFRGFTESARHSAVNADMLVQAQKTFQRNLIIHGVSPGPTGFKGKTRFPDPMGE